MRHCVVGCCPGLYVPSAQMKRPLHTHNLIIFHSQAPKPRMAKDKPYAEAVHGTPARFMERFATGQFSTFGMGHIDYHHRWVGQGTHHWDVYPRSAAWRADPALQATPATPMLPSHVTMCSRMLVLLYVGDMLRVRGLSSRSPLCTRTRLGHPFMQFCTAEACLPGRSGFADSTGGS